MVKLNETTFYEFINSSERVIVKFGAKWCSPCIGMEPALEAVSTKYPGLVGDVDIEESDNKTIATRFSIRNIPTTIVFQNGEVIERKIGPAREDILENMLTGQN